MSKLSFIFIFSIINLAEHQSLSSGIYLPTQCSKYDRVHVVIFTSKTICIANRPIIPIDDFEKISPIKEWDNKVYFDITLSSNALMVLKKLNLSFPYVDLALVIEQDVYMVFNIADRQLNQTFRFQVEQSELGEFNNMRNKLIDLMRK